MSNLLSNSELGKKSAYNNNNYNPDLLFPIPRLEKRTAIGINNNDLPFKGYDCWNHYEVSWLNTKGKPVVAVAQIFYDCSSENIIESKSLKLYFNSFNNTKFTDLKDVEKIITQDLAKAVGTEVIVKISELNKSGFDKLAVNFAGECLDHLDIECTDYMVNPEFLSINGKEVSEIVYSDLLKSNCLVTNQPDWGSIQISYTGRKIDHAGLLKYLISFRNHNEFHEQCIERIFVDILKYCKPRELTVSGRYTRRGGLDINPYRTNKPAAIEFENIRLVRQ
jgi:7-cyano-7-deazaguanine reductase